MSTIPERFWAEWPVCPTMIGATFRAEVDPRHLGQLLADAVTAAAWPMAAIVAWFEPTADELAALDRYTWVAGTAPVERTAAYMVALYVAPGEDRPDAAGLQVMAYEAAGVAASVEFGTQVELAGVPVVTVDALRASWPSASAYFRTTA